MNSFDDFTGLDFEIETTQTGMGRIVLGLMLALFVAFSALTTFSFFATYAADIGQMFGEYAWIVSGVTGFLLLDVAGLMWTFVRARNADTTTQFNIASISALCTIGASVLVSFIYVALSATLDVGIYNEYGGLTNIGQALNVIGVIIMALAFAGNFAAIAAYVNTSSTITKAVQNTQMSATARQGQFAAERLTIESTIKRTINDIARQIPERAAQAGTQNANQFVNAKFAGLDKNNDGEISRDEVAAFVRKNPDLAQELFAMLNTPRHEPVEAVQMAAESPPLQAFVATSTADLNGDGENFTNGNG